MNVDLKITGRIESLHLEPGDTVVATVEGSQVRNRRRLVVA
jgi:uncharacterized Zn finger protein